MGFFDKVRDVLTSSDAQRAKNAREAADKAAAEADRVREDAHEQADKVRADAQDRADEAQRRADDAARGAGDPAEPTTAEDAAGAEEKAAQKEARAEEEEARAHAAAGSYRTHTVRTGDTLASIAEHYGVDRHEMAALNRLDNPDLIYPGQVFRVPHG